MRLDVELASGWANPSSHQPLLQRQQQGMQVLLENTYKQISFSSACWMAQHARFWVWHACRPTITQPKPSRIEHQTMCSRRYMRSGIDLLGFQYQFSSMLTLRFWEWPRNGTTTSALSTTSSQPRRHGSLERLVDETPWWGHWPRSWSTRME